MTTRAKSLLFEQLAAYGYPLTVPVRRSDPEMVLEGLLRQQEGRVVEGFPVVLLNALREKANLRWELPTWNPEKTLGAKTSKRLAYLLALSYVLFRLFGLEKDARERVLKLLSKYKSHEETVRDVESHFLRSDPLPMNGFELSTERLKHTFRTYVADGPKELEDTEKTRALQLELLLSELFTPRQKELLRKRSAGKQMTNTEKTYFYRTVNKRLKALADEDVHAFARRLLRR